MWGDLFKYAIKGGKISVERMINYAFVQKNSYLCRGEFMYHKREQKPPKNVGQKWRLFLREPTPCLRRRDVQQVDQLLGKVGRV